SKSVKVTKKEALNIITNENVSAALTKDKGNDVKLLSYEVEDFTKPGDNYAGVVTRVYVTYTHGGTTDKVSYIVKVNPKRNMPSYETFLHQRFLREGHYFTVFLPEMNQLLEKFNHPALRLSKGYFLSLESCNEILFLEDLRLKGFKMRNRKIGFDKAHGLLVMNELGRLHAASLLKEKYIGADSFEKYGVLNDYVKELMDDPKQSVTIKAWFSGQLDTAIKMLEKVPGYSAVVAWLRDLQPRCLEVYYDLLQPTDKFRVIIHGDCWSNNIMFRYDEENNPVEAMLVDLQMIKQTSPALDLHYFLYSSFNGFERVKYFDKFLSAYYNAFSNTLKAGEIDPPFTLKELHEEFQRTQLFGCLTCLFLVPVVLADEKDIIDVEKVSEEKLHIYRKERQATLLDMASREGSLLKARFLETFDEMLEHGIIS
ncbi:unnamed protein product, partial [Meganyctiphanes norvegica]